MLFDPEQKKCLERLCRSYDIAALILFGSQARSLTHKKSDVDFGFFSRSRNPQLMEIARMEFDFAQKLAISHLELVNLRRTSASFRHQVAKDAQILYEDTPDAYANFVVSAFKQYGEEKKL